jgi:hypothetical protein
LIELANYFSNIKAFKRGSCNDPQNPKRIGTGRAIRFITIPKSKRIESVKRHREWQKMLSKDIFFDEVFVDKST